jgi:hypothetical protein
METFELTIFTLLPTSLYRKPKNRYPVKIGAICTRKHLQTTTSVFKRTNYNSEKDYKIARTGYLGLHATPDQWMVVPCIKTPPQ